MNRVEAINHVRRVLDSMPGRWEFTDIGNEGWALICSIRKLNTNQEMDIYHTYHNGFEVTCDGVKESWVSDCLNGKKRND